MTQTWDQRLIGGGIAVAIVVGAWFFGFLLSPFVYSLYGAWKRSRPITGVPFVVF